MCKKEVWPSGHTFFRFTRDDQGIIDFLTGLDLDFFLELYYN